MKYKLTDETKEFCGKLLHRIVCVTAFASVAVGDTGGWVESEKNLSQSGNAWVSGDAKVSGNAEVYGNAEVSGNAWVYGDAWVSAGNAKVYGNAWVSGNAEVSKSSDYAVYKNSWSSMRYFTWTRSNDKWCVGCFYGSGEELIEKAYKDSKLSGDCYKAVVELRNKLTELESA